MVGFINVFSYTCPLKIILKNKKKNTENMK